MLRSKRAVGLAVSLLVGLAVGLGIGWTLPTPGDGGFSPCDYMRAKYAQSVHLVADYERAHPNERVDDALPWLKNWAQARDNACRQ